MKYQKNKLKDKIFLNFNFSVTIAYKDLKFCLLSPHMPSEGTVSQILDLGLCFYLMSKNGKHLKKCLSIMFEVA